MSFEVKVPAVGESITEGVLTAWEKKSGEFVKADEALFELETDKVTMTINAEESGRLETLVEEGETVEIGQVVAKIDTGAEGKTGKEVSKPDRAAKGEEKAEAEKAAPGDASPEREKESPSEAGASPASPATETLDLSPAVRRLVRENRLDPARIEATGKDGRLTKEDVVRHLESREKETRPEAAAKSEDEKSATGKAETREILEPAFQAKPKETQRQTRTPLTSIRKRIAQRLVESQQDTATLTTFNEADMSNVIAWRNRFKEPFKETHEVGLGFMSFFVKASIDALQKVPQFNAQIDGEEIVENHFYDIGIAVGTERGLVVPVLRDADQMSFAEIERQIADLARRAKEKSLTLDDLEGGCFTISNGGVYGSLLSTPILNPPQSGILGMHAIKKRPVAVGDQIEIRPMMYLAVSYDHRLVDGRESVAFLKRIVECIENPERMLLEI